MHPHLELLLELQDLKMQRRELLEEPEERRLEEEVFRVSVEAAVDELDRKIADMEARLPPAVRSRYERLTRRGRAVVPVIGGVCYGCFVRVPTAVWAADAGRNEELHVCENCGRFLYLTP